MDASGGVTEIDERGSHSADKSASDVERGQNHETKQKNEGPVEDWKISTHQLYIILSLTVINLVVALDATVVVTALSVRQPDRIW
jgi:hypothetical protein